MKCTTITLSLLLLAAAAGAQQPWTLEKCLAKAVANNILLKRQVLTLEASEKKLTQSMYDRLPDLNGYYSHHLNNGKALNSEEYKYVNQQFYDGSVGLYSNLPLFEGFSHHHQIRKNESLRDEASFNYEKYANDLKIQVVQSYLSILYNLELKAVAQLQLALAGTQVVQIEQLLAAGVTTKDELLKMKYQQASEQVRVRQVEQDLRNDYIRMIHLLALEDNETDPFTIETPEDIIFLEKDIPPPDSLYTTAVGIMPELKAREARVNVSEQDVKLASSAFYPRLSLAYQYYTRYNDLSINPLEPGLPYTVFDQLGDNTYGQLRLGLEIPVFNKFTARTSRALAGIQLQDAIYAMKEAKHVLYQEIVTAYNNMQSARETYHMQTEAVDYARESYRLAEKKLDEGVISVLDFNLEKNTVIKAESDLLRAKYNYVFSLKLLDLYMGKDIQG